MAASLQSLNRLRRQILLVPHLTRHRVERVAQTLGTRPSITQRRRLTAAQAAATWRRRASTGMCYLSTTRT